MNYVCPIHGPHVAPMCSRCLMDVAGAVFYGPSIPMRSWDSATNSSEPSAFSDVEYYPPLNEMKSLQEQDKADVEAFIKSLDGVR